LAKTFHISAKHGTSDKPETTPERLTQILLTPDEIADLLRTSRKAVYVMVERKQIPGVVRIGRRILFRRFDVMRWLEDLAKPR
jgi:excisionase family DNA binding protein